MDKLAPFLIVAALLLGLGPGLWCDLQARERLSAEGEKNPWHVYLAGVFASRQMFTQEGWRYHVKSIKYIMGGVALALLVALAVKWW